MSSDYLFALQLQNEFDNLANNETHYIDLTKSTSNSTSEYEANSKKQKRDISNNIIQHHQISKNTESVVDQAWETLDPNPDIHGLFLTFNKHYFWGTLDTVMIQWSKRMTVCAGLCKYENGFCSISLSEPLLKLRPRKDLVETLLHEMIHAYLFLTNNREHRDRDGHGPEFCKHMYRINVEAGTKISIYHDFHEEVRLYKQHWWKCNGLCQNNKPFYGYVKRSMNRAPGPYDRWWASHQANCGGIFIKVKEPTDYGLKKRRIIPTYTKKPVKQVNKITNFIELLGSTTNTIPEESVNQQKDNQDIICLDTVDETTLCPICNDTVLKDWLNSHLQNCSQLKEMFGNIEEDNCKCPVCNNIFDRSLMNEHLESCKMLCKVFENDYIYIPDVANYVNCPNCDKKVNECNINEHLDICISIKSNATSISVSLEPTSIAIEDEVKLELKCPCCGNIFNNIIELDDHIDNC